MDASRRLGSSSRAAHVSAPGATRPTRRMVNHALESGSYRPRPFRPAPWLPGAHLQTVGGKLLRPSARVALRRLRVDTPDGDFLDLELGPDPGEQAGVILVLHGLEGSARRGYMHAAYAALASRGLRPVGMNFRSCSGEPNRLPRFYHSGETGDLRLVLDVLAARHPGRPLGVLGFSLGGNVLLKHLGEVGRHPGPVRAAAAVSVPFDLSRGATRLEQGLTGRVYTYYFLRMLHRKWQAKAALLSGRHDLDRVFRTRTLRAFDEAATAPLHGFRDAEDYYRQCSSAAWLDRIRVPTLLLQSRDDPFLPREALPEEAVARNPWLIPAFTDRGGHVGFVEGPGPWAPRFWAEEEAAAFLAHQLTPSSGPHAGASRSDPAQLPRSRRPDQIGGTP